MKAAAPGAEPQGPDRESLPPLLTGARRWHLAALIALAVSRAVVSVMGAALAGRLIAAAGSETAVQGAVVAAAAAVVVVATCVYAERLVAERLGQDYIHELRVRLLRSTLDSERQRSAGVTIARSTNDLTAVRNWVGQGIAPLVAGLPLIVVSIAWLSLESVWLGAAVGAPMLLLAGVLALLAGPSFRRAREVRRRRGRLAARVADTVHARDSIRFSGGTGREMRRVDRDGRLVVDAAVARAEVTGGLRAASMAAPLAASLGVGVVAALGQVESAMAASALMLAGVIGAQCTELGRVVEYRQNYRAARRIIGPVLNEAPGGGAASDGVPVGAEPSGSPERLEYARRGAGGSVAEPLLIADPGEAVRLVGPPARIDELFTGLAGLSPHRAASLLGGSDVGRLPSRRRRALVGAAGASMALERGSLLRSVRYRVPGSSDEEALCALESAGADVGAWERDLPQGWSTLLKHGGSPLSASQRAQVHLARAILGTPPVLLLNRLDADLDEAGRGALRALVRTYPGVVVFASSAPETVAPSARTVVVPE
ncbi:ABC-type multidrug/protein/lipid transport system, ATPase [Zhihengliuella salsuginis]|uniref:ABC-type multidrug/protein/lipid transport system, ATPase n=1 Tax=Zhihengliuella salsuginis TaxID=578222 RepID=A0ABQ3GKP0_9MICC|nr:ABC-type multidrug/protein/lipid transport system, ATPase [Zhihengliuella salsuginis]